jgi:hypothetical protein
MRPRALRRLLCCDGWARSCHWGLIGTPTSPTQRVGGSHFSVIHSWGCWNFSRINLVIWRNVFVLSRNLRLKRGCCSSGIRSAVELHNGDSCRKKGRLDVRLASAE